MKYRVLLALLAELAACNRTPPKRETQTPPEYFRVDPATAASLRGTVRFEGKRPAGKPIVMDSEKACQELHNAPLIYQAVETGRNGALANAFVYVKAGLEGKVFAPPETAVVLDQRGCWFVPRLVALRAGQTLAVRNSDPVSHNIHPKPLNNRDWNQQQPPESEDLRRRFARPEVMIPVKCDIHSWMRAWIGVLDHPYFAVTGASGAFALENLPPGVYTVAVWHEHLGEITRSVRVQPKEAASADFLYRH
jgi:plastocyanin